MIALPGGELGYDTIKQVHSRVSAYKAIEYINDKAEIIVLDGHGIHTY